MGSLYGLLATQEAMKKLPIAVALWCVLILVLGFAIGFKKGFRRVAWGGFYWLFASSIYERNLLTYSLVCSCVVFSQPLIIKSPPWNMPFNGTF